LDFSDRASSSPPVKRTVLGDVSVVIWTVGSRAAVVERKDKEPVGFSVY